MRHPRGLDFDEQRKVVMLRDDKHWSWKRIADPAESGIYNIEGLPTCRDVVRLTYRKFFQHGRKKEKYAYANCGRKAWKLTPDVKQPLIRHLIATRKKDICTSKTLQFMLAADKGIAIDDSTIRKFLTDNGYEWRPRAQKRAYSSDEMIVREMFAKRVCRMSAAQIRTKMALSIDGVVLTMPPKDDVGRWNHCVSAETHMWRKPFEAASPELAGFMPYKGQVPIERAVPFWGGISQGGCGYIVFHEFKKCSIEEWCDAIQDGTLGRLLRRLNPRNTQRSWKLLCDGEGFLHSKDARKWYGRRSISTWKIPAHSPDLNPIEKFWSWLRRELRRRDLVDFKSKRAPITKAQYIARVKQVLTTRRANLAAANIAKSLKKVCKEVVDKKGAAARS